MDTKFTKYAIVGTTDGKYWVGHEQFGTNPLSEGGDIIFPEGALLLGEINELHRVIVESERYVPGMMIKDRITIVRENIIFYCNKMISDSFITIMEDRYK